MKSDYETLNDNVRKTFAGIVWTHKIHEKQADIYYKKSEFMKNAGVITSALTYAGVSSAIFVDQSWVKITSVLVSFISTAINLYLKSNDLNARIQSHKKTAVELLELKDEFESLLMHIKNSANHSIADLEKTYNELKSKKNKIYKNAPITTEKAVKLAKQALNISKDNKFSDEEIDGFLPSSLHKEKLPKWI